MMKLYQTILIKQESDTCNIYLNRLQKGNAINLLMMRELTESVTSINNDNSIRFIVITSTGKNFCTGADLEWMENAASLSPKKNLSECIELAELFALIYHSPKIVITLINGACIGGGIGFIAASDFSITSTSAYFAFSEVLLGLVPAVISPYIINKIGINQAKKLMLTGEKLSCKQAMESGLIHYMVPSEELESAKEKLLEDLRKGDAEAQKTIKSLLNNLNTVSIKKKLIRETAALLASVRVSTESKSRISDFVRKRNQNIK